jgi:hypothetical protein
VPATLWLRGYEVMAGKVCPSRTRGRLSAQLGRFHPSPPCCWVDRCASRIAGTIPLHGHPCRSALREAGEHLLLLRCCPKKERGVEIRLAWSVSIRVPGVASSGTWSPGQALRTSGRDVIAGGR